MNQQLAHLKKLDDGQLTKKMCVILKEEKTYLMKMVVKHIPRSTIMDMLEETFEIEESGGMYITQSTMNIPCCVNEGGSNTKRKSMGGIFLTLMKQKVDKEVVKRINDAQNRVSKEKKNVTRCFGQFNLKK